VSTFSGNEKNKALAMAELLFDAATELQFLNGMGNDFDREHGPSNDSASL
jgi:hypothetical protein